MKDPDVEIERQEYLDFMRKYGRAPSFKDLEVERAKMDARLNEERRLYEARENERLAAERITRREREELIQYRRSSRSREPKDYSNPQSAEEFRTLVSAKSNCYAERTQLVGSERRIEILDVDLEDFNLSRSNFRNVTFGKGANLRNAQFHSCTFAQTAFVDCLLEGAEFHECTFEGVSFAESAALTGASFQFSKFKLELKVLFDRNQIGNAVFLSGRKDAWYGLSTQFAGVWQYINVALFGAYLVPLLVKLYLFSAVAKAQMEVYNAVQREKLLAITAWEFVLGKEVHAILTAFGFFSYQFARLYMTLRIGPMIEAEKRTGFTPDKDGYVDYIRTQVWLKVLGVLVLCVVSRELYEMLSMKIYFRP